MGDISTFLIGKSIFITQFPRGEILRYSRGEITRIEGYALTYNASTDKGSSGSPIFLKNTTEVIGIHKQGDPEELQNIGNFLYPVIEIIISYNKPENNKAEDIVKYKKENNERFTYKNGEYYIGKWLNDQRHGKGTLYYKNNKIKYEGDFANDKYEGTWKLTSEDGRYYIGQWLNGLYNGKGTIYYKNNTIQYEGEFINGKPEGNGKYI